MKDVVFSSMLMLFNRLTIVLVLCISIIACSGGISGTGDGGPIIIDGEGGDVAASPDGNGVSEPTHSTDSPNQLSALELFPSQLMLPINSALATRYANNDRFPTQPVTHIISTRLSRFVETGINVQLDLAQLEEQLIGSLNQCDASAACQFASESVTTQVSQETLNYALSLTPQADTLPVLGNQTVYSQINYSDQLSGYYDNQIEYTRDGDTRVALSWTTDKQLVSMYVEDSNWVTHSLADLRQLTMTKRIQNKIDATTLTATTRVNNENTTLEASWQGRSQYYLRVSANAESTVLYAISPNDPNTSAVRESIELATNSYSIETCGSQTIPCDNWVAVVTDDSNAANPFSNSENFSEDFSTTLTSGLTLVLPAEVDGFVISNSGLAQQPTARSQLCAGQRVLDELRTFCWQPLPLMNASAVYEETQINGSVVYRRLDNVSVEGQIIP